MVSDMPSGSCSAHERRLSVQRDSSQRDYPRDSSNLEMDVLPGNHQTSRPQAFSNINGDSDSMTFNQRPHSRSLRPEDTISAHQPSVEAGGAASEAPLAPAGDNRDEASQTDAATPAGEEPPDPYARLPKHQADILRRQVETPQRSYAFWTMYRYATKLDIAIIIISALASVASGAAMPLMTIVFGGLQGTFQDYMFLETISYSQFEDEIARFVLYFVYLAIGIFFATYISTVGFIYTGEHITTNLRQRYLESCLRQNIGFFDKFGAGEVAVKITSDANRIQDGISEKVGLLISSIATVLTGFLIGFVLTWKLTLIMCSVIIALLLNTAIWTVCIVKYAMPMAISAAKASGLTQEIFSAIRVAIAFGSQTRLVQQYDTHLKASQGAGFRMKAAIGMMMAVVMGMMHLIYGLGFWQGSVFLARDEIGIEKMLTALMAVMVGSLTVASIGPYFQAFTDAASTVSHLMFVIDRETPLDGTDTETGDKPEHVEGHLRLQNIQHIYPSRPDVTVMDNVTLDFDAGRVTALVGASGSGKSTIVGLIERFYDPVQGQVYLDGRDISTLNLQWLRQQVGLVGQEPNLFAGTVYENISYGLIGSKHEHADSAAQRELIVTAARQANAHDFISQLSDGYETDIGQRGLLLSGGQKQRIAIARAIVSNPKILLLDEATSALDTKSEGIVQAALDQASKGRTTITIAHRISTVRDAYKIIVMSQGRVVEQGDHQQLLRMRGAYFDLISAQQFNERETMPPLELEVGESGVKVEGDVSSNSTDKTRLGGVKEDVDQPTPASESSGMLVTADEVQQAADAEKETYRLWTLIKFVATFSKQETGLVIVALLFCIICGLATPVQSVFFAKQLITLSSIGVPGQDTGEARSESDFWSLMFLMLGLVTLIAHGIQGVALAYTAEALLRRLRSKTLSYMLRQDVSFFDRNGNSPSSLTATIAVETTQLTTMGGTALGNILVSLTTVVGGISLSLAIGWKLALVCLSVVPLLVACSIVRFYVLYKYTDRASRLYVASAAYASENISAMRTVASLTLEKLVADKYGDDLHRQRKQSLVSVSKSAALYAASQSFIFLCLGLAFWYGSTLLATYEYDIFQFFVCLMSVIFGAQSAGSLLTFIPDLVKARHSAAYLKQLFDTKPKIDTWDDTQGKRLLHMEGRLEFQNVHFRYPTRPERPVLQGLNLLLEAGKHAALVGASGCGKSTTIALLERFYDPNGGKILIDGEDITQIQINSYRNHVALVSQEPALFEGSIRDNICMGHAGKAEDVPDRVIEEACRDAAIYDFIVSLPEGFNTDIGSAGSLLSGGQKQRIAIARAMVRSPKILLLDEATSALDSESELLVQTALERAAKGRTTLTVAHRLTTIQNADVIYVIDQGRVIESGTHQDLMDRNGRYTELVKLQSFE